MDTGRRPTIRCFHLIPALVLASALHLAAQDRVPADSYLLHLTVTDARGRPLLGAEIQFDGAVAGITDATGQYYLARKPLPDKSHTVAASLPGFETASRKVTGLSELTRSKSAPGIDLTLQLTPVKSPATVEVLRGESPPNYAIVPVFYVTDRADTGNQDPALRYSAERSSAPTIAHGICEVTIPSTHVPGDLEGPSWLHFEFIPDPDKHVVLRSLEALDPDPFYQKLAASVANSPSKEAVVFVHGYKTSFEHAARQAAQLAHDAHFQGTPILYSWPSKNRLLAYTEDEDTVAWTAFHLRDFLKELAQRSHAAKIHLIAHSMGNRALASALQMIASGRDPKALPLFHQVVLAAPDIGADTLVLFAREIRPAVRRLTLYASENDDALLLSRYIHGAPRAGQKSAYLLVADGIDTVDASAARTDFLGHNYYASSGSIIDDIQKILAREIPPELRNLIPATIQNLKYWIIPGAPHPAAP